MLNLSANIHIYFLIGQTFSLKKEKTVEYSRNRKFSLSCHLRNCVCCIEYRRIQEKISLSTVIERTSPISGMCNFKNVSNMSSRVFRCM